MRRLLPPNSKNTSDAFPFPPTVFDVFFRASFKTLSPRATLATAKYSSPLLTLGICTVPPEEDNYINTSARHFFTIF